MTFRHLLLASSILLPLSANSDPELNAAFLVMLFKPQCDAHIDGFQVGTAADYAAWLRKNPQATQGDPAAASPQAPEPSTAEELAQLRTSCDMVLDELRPSDPRLKTPEATWALFLQALRANDKSAIANCFEASARGKYMDMFRDAPAEQLVAMADGLKDFKSTTVSDAAYHQAVVKRSDGKSGFVLFVKTGSGWRISEL